MIRIIKTLLLSLILSTALIAWAETFVRDDVNTDPTPSAFTVCHGGTCENLEKVSLTDTQWLQIRKIFKINRTPQQERKNIKLAIAKLEKIVGRLTDTYNDKAENKSDDDSNHYMDCIDESTNTTIYLMMIQRDGLLRWHTYQDRGNRGYFFNGWPHTTAVIKETRSGQQYAVDSWFRDNGLPPYIVPFDVWRNGWRPE